MKGIQQDLLHGHERDPDDEGIRFSASLPYVSLDPIVCARAVGTLK